MADSSIAEKQILNVTSFEDLVSIPFQGHINAICWVRELSGDFSEIVRSIQASENIITIAEEELNELQLTRQGQLAREILLNDMKLLKENGASPVLNIISNYDRDDSFLPTDVYSFHVDRSPVPTNTFLCTYYGRPSEILPNSQSEQKILIPEIRRELKNLYNGSEENFGTFLSEHFYDLHYSALPGAQPVNLGTGNMWRLAVDHPDSKVLPCVHRAPLEKPGEKRLLMIC